MNQQTFEILYNAMVEIATAKTFFDESQAMQAIARKALKDIAKPQQPINNNCLQCGDPSGEFSWCDNHQPDAHMWGLNHAQEQKL